MTFRIRQAILLMAALSFLGGCGSNQLMSKTNQEEPIPVKFVVVTHFTIDGEQAGEFQHWKERRNLDTRFSFPQGHHDLYLNEETGVLGMVTGIGTAYSASAVMALGLDSRFDLSDAYWLIAGISGVDPNSASLGSAAWADYVVDGDLGHLIDAREIPDDWETGFFARHTEKPYDPNMPEPTLEVQELNKELSDWAFELTRDADLPDSGALEESRNRYSEHPNARKPPFVLKGDQLAAMTFWHGEIKNEWANKWVDYWTQGEGEFVTSAMEDSGSYLSLQFLDNLGAVDSDRVMVLRTASNYTMQPPGLTAVENLLSENEGYAGLDAALESAYIVGSTVMDEILDNWDRYADETPSLGSQ